MKKTLVLLLIFLGLFAGKIYANDTIRWTCSIGYVPATHGFNFSGTEGGRFGIDWGDGQDTVVIGSGEVSGYGDYVKHIYVDKGIYAVRLYALTADAGITAFDAGYSLRTLDVSACTALTKLDCGGNQLTALDVSHNPDLTSLQCGNNKLTALDVSHNPDLTSLWCANNKLTTLDVSQNINLTSLDCSYNSLSTLDVSACVNLTTLYCAHNNLSFSAVAEIALALSRPGDDDCGPCVFTPQSYPQRFIKSGSSLPVPELPVIKGKQAHLDVYRNGHLLDGQGYTIADNQLYFEEIGNYKLVVWHDSVRERKYGYDENDSYRLMNKLYGDTTFVTVYSDYVDGHDLARWTWEKEKSREENRVYLYFAGTAGETFVIDWGDGERTLAEGTGESIQYAHAYDTATRQVEWLLYGTTPEARILKLEKNSNVGPNEKLNVSACPELTHLTWNGDREEWGLVALDVSACKALTYLDCYDNLLTSLDVSRNLNLMDLRCEDNILTSLDVSKNLNLTKLNCEDNCLTSLDISKNLALEELDCGWNVLRSIDVSKNVALASLNCEFNELQTLDVSHNIALRALDCDMCHLTTLDISNNVNLEELSCEDNQLKSLDVSENLDLSVLFCNGNYLPSLDISRNVNLNRLWCSFNPLTSLDVSKNVNLKDLSCTRTQLTALDVSKNINLVELGCSYNQLTSLDVSKSLNLEYLWCNNNRLTSLDVSKNLNLMHLWCENNFLTFLDISQNPRLGELECGNNRLTSLDLSAQWHMDHLEVDGNFFEVPLDRQRAYDLTTLPGMDGERILLVKGGRVEGGRLIFEADEVEYCYMTEFEPVNSWNHRFDTLWFRLVSDRHDEPQIPLTAEFFPDSIFRAYVTTFDKDGNDSLCAHECAVVKEINVGGECEGAIVYWHSTLQSLEGLQYFGNLEELICGAAELTSLDVSHNPALVEIYCPHNHLKTLVVSDKPALRYLSIYHNELTNLTVSNCPELRDLYCHNNSLAKMEIGGCPELNWLNCANNRLTSVDVSHLPALEALYCQGNDLSDLDVRANHELEFVGIFFNHFPLSKIAALRAAWPNDGYDEDRLNLSPQRIAVELPIGKTLDLSKELWLEGVETEVDFGDIAADAYTFVDGRLKFNRTGGYEVRLLNEAMRSRILQREVDGGWFLSGGIGGLEVFYDITVKSSDPDNPDDPDDPDDPDVANEDGACARAYAYVRDHTIFLSEDLGEMRVFTMLGQCIYRGQSRMAEVPCAGLYIVQAGTRTWKVIVR